MPAIKRTKTSFAAGELAPELLGRADLRAYENGARRLRNVVIQPTGGVTRRPGLRHVTMLPGIARLLPFEFNTEQTYLMVLTAGKLAVYAADLKIIELIAPWTETMLPQIGFTQNADTLLLTHPDMRPQRVQRSNTGWSITPWSFTQDAYFRFAAPEITLTPSALNGTITISASAPVFAVEHIGVRLRIGGKRVLVSAVNSPSTIVASVEQPLTSTTATKDWDEAAFSTARGWPVTCCFHQDRLVIGGSRDLPNRLWLSRTGDLFNFDPGTGLDDEAIAFSLLSDQVNAIRGVFSGQHLQLFTSGAEWMVTGDPLTPANIQINRQTRVGSPVDRLVPPVDVDGSTIFVSRGGQGVYEFAYTQVQQAYQANDLAILGRHLIKAPRAMAYDQRARLLHLVMEDGALATLTLYRAEQVTAWTRQETSGAFLAITEVEGTLWCVVERSGGISLERFEDGLMQDAGLTGTSITPKSTWTGLAHLNGRQVAILADGAVRPSAIVASGAITLSAPATQVAIGLAFTHEIEPLPADLITPNGSATGPSRLVAITFRLLETPAVDVDLGSGPQALALRRFDIDHFDAPPAPFTGDATLRGLGWRRDRIAPLWRITGAAPLPLTLLSVTTEIRMND
ncbi:MAG: hypothetical protein INF75_16165 [Roseomonas sp.]|nr:hypothetical protein [Roseomonas sp.]MCA3332389.1 hypothetical protein [Roseomonas sp.]MCA3336747.1 hypothetical protein [Roseomonas sp.]MCA3345679.1 hypothetical protein [Roseomonas sp.]MCA3353129.1 hypothetical protein [Roseomonas sp.]